MYFTVFCTWGKQNNSNKNNCICGEQDGRIFSEFFFIKLQVLICMNYYISVFLVFLVKMEGNDNPELCNRVQNSDLRSIVESQMGGIPATCKIGLSTEPILAQLKAQRCIQGFRSHQISSLPPFVKKTLSTSSVLPIACQIRPHSGFLGGGWWCHKSYISDHKVEIT